MRIQSTIVNANLVRSVPCRAAVKNVLTIIEKKKIDKIKPDPVTAISVVASKNLQSMKLDQGMWDHGNGASRQDGLQTSTLVVHWSKSISVPG